MIEFLYLFLLRAISGGQNGFGYAKRGTLRAITSFIMTLILGLTLAVILQRAPESYWKLAAALGMVVSLAGVIGVEDSFNPKYKIFATDIHLWEILILGGVTIAFASLGANLISIACSVYPGLILHKGFVNIGSGKKWWYAGTDDKTGKTFSIPLLNLKIPRISTRARISIAVISVMVMIINTSLNWEISLQTVLNWIL